MSARCMTQGDELGWRVGQRRERKMNLQSRRSGPGGSYAEGAVAHPVLSGCGFYLRFSVVRKAQAIRSLSTAD